MKKENWENLNWETEAVKLGKVKMEKRRNISPGPPPSNSRVLLLPSGLLLIVVLLLHTAASLATNLREFEISPDIKMGIKMMDLLDEMYLLIGRRHR